MKHRGMTLGGKCGRSCTGEGGGIHHVGGYETPNLCVMQPPHGSSRMRPRGEGPQSIRSGGLRWWPLSRMPPPGLKGNAPTHSPKPAKVAKVAAQPPPEALDVEALGTSVATLLTDTCQSLVEQAAAKGVKTALAKGRAADRKSAMAKAEKFRGNTQGALDQALNLAAKLGGELETTRWALRVAEEGRRNAEVEAAGLRMGVEALQRKGDDLQQRLGRAEAQVCSLTTTLSTTFTAQQGLGPPGGQSQGSGTRVGVNDSWVCLGGSLSPFFVGRSDIPLSTTWMTNWVLLRDGRNILAFTTLPGVFEVAQRTRT